MHDRRRGARSVATLATVAGCSHISVCIAGANTHRAARGQQRVGEQVVGEAVGGLGQQVGGGRRDDHQVGVLADADVRHLVDVGPDLGGDRLAGQRRPGRRADEPQRGRGRHDPDRVADSVNSRSSSHAL